MEPVPETSEVLDALASTGNDQLSRVLREMARKARAIAPRCVGLSLGLVEEGLTFTLVASDGRAAGLDAVQYVDDGPCLAAQRDCEVVETRVPDLLDEEHWAAFARASAATGIASSLSIPIEREGRVVGGVNLYGATPDAFDGRHQELAAALGTAATGAVTNADLSFATRLAAAEAPGAFRHTRDVDVALGIVAELREVDIDTARKILEHAAARAGIPLVDAARVLVHIYGA